MCVEKTANVFVFNYQRSDEFDKKLLDAMVGSGVSDQTSYTRDIKMAFELGAVEVIVHSNTPQIPEKCSSGEMFVVL